MILPIILAVAGLLLIFFEFFLPGGIMGLFGAFLLICSVILLATSVYSPIVLIAFIVTLGGLLYLCIHFALKKVRKTGGKGTMFLDSDQAGFYAS